MLRHQRKLINLRVEAICAPWLNPMNASLARENGDRQPCDRDRLAASP